MNVEAIKRVLERTPFMALMALYLGYLGYDYYFFFRSDPSSPLLQKRQELVATKDEVAKLETKVRQVHEFIQTLGSTRSEIRALVQELETTRATLVENIDQAELMKSLYIEAKRSGLRVTSLNPVDRPRGTYQQPDPDHKDAAKEEYYSEEDFEMQATGIYFQFVAFLDRVANLQKIVRVDNLTFSSASPSTARYVELNGTLGLKAYRYMGGKADEVARLQDQLRQDNTQPAGASAPGSGAARPKGGR